MKKALSRRDLLQLSAFGGVAFASGLLGCSAVEVEPSNTPTVDHTPPRVPAHEDFFFVQISDTHWGFSGPPSPDADVNLPHAVEALNAVKEKPAFVVFTGDLTQTTDDAAVRRTRMHEFKEIVSRIEGTRLVFLPGEHDAALDKGEAYREVFGELHQSFDHQGVHFVCLDNVSDPTQGIGDAQLAWMKDDLAKTAADVPVVVFAHRPLFDLAPEWDWATRDGAHAIALLEERQKATVFYGHIHQIHHQTTGKVEHHAARSLIFPLPVPRSQPKKAPLPWDAQAEDHGIGIRNVRTHGSDVGLDDPPFRPLSRPTAKTMPSARG